MWQCERGWPCDCCARINEDSREKCHWCGTPGSNALLSILSINQTAAVTMQDAIDWTCPQCTYVNKQQLKCCEICKTELSTKPLFVPLTSSAQDRKSSHKEHVAKISDGKRTELRICMVGKTGSGKSSLGNSLFGREVFKAECSGSSVTKQCQHVTGDVLGRNVMVLDTPGVFDTETISEYIEDEIIKCAATLAPGPHAIILVIKIDRFTEEELQTVPQLKRAFGTDMMSRVIVVFTAKDQLQNKTIEQFLESAPETMTSQLDECDGRFLAFDNTAEGDDNNEQVERLLNMIERLANSKNDEYYSSQIFRDADDTMKDLEWECFQLTNLNEDKTIDYNDLEMLTEDQHQKIVDSCNERERVVTSQITKIHFENNENRKRLEQFQKQAVNDDTVCGEDDIDRRHQIECDKIRNKHRNISERLWDKLEKLQTEKRKLSRDRKTHLRKLRKKQKYVENFMYLQVGDVRNILRNRIHEEHIFRRLRQRMQQFCERMRNCVRNVISIHPQI